MGVTTFSTVQAKQWRKHQRLRPLFHSVFHMPVIASYWLIGHSSKFRLVRYYHARGFASYAIRILRLKANNKRNMVKRMKSKAIVKYVANSIIVLTCLPASFRFALTMKTG